jgi:Family of unknown function (DUF5681)
MTRSEKTGQKQKPQLFKPGQSGNPAGRPKGARNATTLAVEALLDGEGEALTRKAIDLAKKGDMQALKLCMDRIVPPRRDRPLAFALPPIGSPGAGSSRITASASERAVLNELHYWARGCGS